MAEKESNFKKYVAGAKDIFYILGMLIAFGGWAISTSKAKATLETTVKYNTEALKNLEEFIDEQSVLNGKIIQYMQMKE